MPPLKPRAVRFGPLEAVALEAPATERLAVFCHGFGAPGTDLVPIGEELARLAGDAADGTTFLFPAAPLSLADIGWGDARAWWMIDVGRLQGLPPEQAVEALRNERPDAAVRAADQLEAFLKGAVGEYGVSGPPILGGFSQGAMVATEVGLRLDEPPALLAIFSGAFVNAESWTERAGRLSDATVVQSHGREDMVLPFASAEALRDLLTGAGAEVTFVPFDGGHTIPLEAMRAVAERL